MKDMSQIELKFDSEQNAFGLTPVANGWLLSILDFNTHKTIAQDSYKSHHVHPAQYPDNAALLYRTSDCRHPSAEQVVCRSSRRDIQMSFSESDS